MPFLVPRWTTRTVRGAGRAGPRRVGCFQTYLRLEGRKFVGRVGAHHWSPARSELTSQITVLSRRWV